MSEAILKINDLKVNYGGIEAVKGISFDVPAGGFPRNGDLRHAAGQYLFYCCDLSHSVSFGICRYC